MGDLGRLPYLTLAERPSRGRPADGMSMSSGDSTVREHKLVKQTGLFTHVVQYGSITADDKMPSATHDISRAGYHVKHLSEFAKQLEDSAARAFPNHGQSQRYKKVQALLLHWKSDDLFVLPELEDLETCLQREYSFETDIFAIPCENSHLALMMKIGQTITRHESSDTLFIVYYGGHARIDESRNSAWLATRSPESPWLQWSAIQTLLEHSLSDVLILLDCCAGAASATFATGNSTTETISASSWDAIAPDPGRYSFTSVLIEVLQEWKNRTYSAAMLHAEMLARLKHPRPEMRNGRHFEARSTPVHFMMTSNHRAPSIEICRVVSEDRRSPSPPQEPETATPNVSGRSGEPQESVTREPDEDKPHVMLSLALEDDQRLDLNAWGTWLAAFPAVAKYVKVHGVFKSHSTLLLLSLPVMVWDMLPENLACNFIAFICSNNLAIEDRGEQGPATVDVPSHSEEKSRPICSVTPIGTGAGNESYGAWVTAGERGSRARAHTGDHFPQKHGPSLITPVASQAELSAREIWADPQTGPVARRGTASPSVLYQTTSNDAITRQMTCNQSRMTTLGSSDNLPPRPSLALHVQSRLEEFFQEVPNPTVDVTEFLASNLGIETIDFDLWFYHRREQQEVDHRLQNLRIDDHQREPPREGPRMVLPGHLNRLLEIYPSGQVLLVDLRAPADYERSHIHGAINFRAPATFVQRATLEMIEKSFVDETSRSLFARWYTSKCVVFYDRQVEFSWECPSAEALFQRFRAKNWTGQAFILKGHYREFSASFDKYIGGTRMSKNARKYLESVTETSPEKTTEDHEQYNEWLEDRVPSTELVPSAEAERMEAMVRHQKALEDEFARRQPSVYRKALDLKTDNSSNWVTMVEPLSRGLAKMQGKAQNCGGNSATAKLPATTRYTGYLDDDKIVDQQQPLAGEDYNLKELDDEPFTVSQKSGTKLSEDAVGASPGGDMKNKGRGRNLSLFSRLRSGR